MHTLAEAEEALRVWDEKNWQHPAGAPTTYHTTLHLTKAVFRALVRAQRAAHEDSHDEFLAEFFDRIASRLIEHSLRLCRTFGTSAAGVLLAETGDGNFVSIKDWADHHGEAIADDFAGAFAALMEAMETLTDLQERQGRGEVVDWYAALRTVPALLKGALGASVSCYEEGEYRFIRRSRGASCNSSPSRTNTPPPAPNQAGRFLFPD